MVFKKWMGLFGLLLVLATEALGQQAQRFAPEALGQDGRITLTPAFSPDGNTLYFCQSECSPIWKCPQTLKFSTLGPAGWSTPKPVILPQLGRADWPSVSPDGSLLLFSWAVKRERHRGKDVDVDFDLYSLRIDEPGAVPKPLDEPDINRIRGGKVRTTRYINNETAPSLTSNGDLYFWTERLDGIGRRDVYLARSNGEGGFRKPEPLPAPINSPSNDAGAWVSPNGKLMLVNYSDRGGLGGNDLFVSTIENGRWLEPVPLGPAVNSPYEDFAARLSPDGATLVFTSDRPLSGKESLLQVWSVQVDQVPGLAKTLAAANL
ncbi:MAG: TolB family protein [Lysobacterales bacterium]